MVLDENGALLFWLIDQELVDGVGFSPAGFGSFGNFRALQAGVYDFFAVDPMFHVVAFDDKLGCVPFARLF